MFSHQGRSEAELNERDRCSNRSIYNAWLSSIHTVGILGVRPNVYAFKIADVFDLDSQTNVPIGYDPSEIPF